jgi:hypothetical protein
MPAIQLTAELSSEQLLQAVTQLSPRELTKFLKQVATVRPPQAEHTLSRQESELLLKINQGVPEPVQQRYNELIAKRRAMTLTPDEYTELLNLTDQVELCDAQRMEYLAELARLRQQPLLVVMDELGLTPLQYE